jgi:hypothetical protein
MSALSVALRHALANPSNGAPLRLRHYCRKLRTPHCIFITREHAENVLFTWSITMRDRDSRTHNLLTVFGCASHWHIGRTRFAILGEERR